MKRILPILVLLLISTTRILHAKGFTVSGNQLLDANGNEFVMRGINVPFAWYYDQSLDNLENIKNSTNANSIRIVWDLSRNYADYMWQDAIERCIELEMIPMIELHDVTCQTSQSELLRMAQWFADNAEYFKRPDIASYILINIANEWGDWYMDGETWRNAYQQAIPIIRNAGINSTLIIDGPDCGKNMEVVRWYGDDLLNTDDNLMFGIHVYCRYNSAQELEQGLQSILDAGLSVFLGEFGQEHPNGSGGVCDIPERDLMRICQEKSIGYMPWSWKGNNTETQMLDMSYDWAGTSLTDWGNTAVNDANGIKNTSVVCSVFRSSEPNPDNIAYNKHVDVSAVEENSGNQAANAVDGNMLTRWSSPYADPQWISIDLQDVYAVDSVVLHWEAAFGKSYSIEVSEDGNNWTTIYETINGDGGPDEIGGLAGRGRYVRIYGTERGSEWGYSLFEVEVFGSPDVVTSLDNNRSIKSLQVFPNPFKENLTVEYGEDIIFVEVSDETGKVLKTIEGSSKRSVNMNLGNLENGVYLLKVFGARRVETRMILK